MVKEGRAPNTTQLLQFKPQSSPQDDVVSMQQPQLTSTSEVSVMALYPHKYRSDETVKRYIATQQPLFLTI